MEQLSKVLKRVQCLNILTPLSLIGLIFVCLYILFYEPLSFDGAFHAQVAKNLYNNGSFVLDYGSNSNIQTKVPFQMVNGLFLWLFGKSFVVANLANVFFLVLLWRLIVKIGEKFQTNWGHVGFIALAFSTPFIYFGFEGYGELPSLALALWGIYYLIYEKQKLWCVVLGGFLIGAAVATKWVLALAAIPFGLVLIYFILDKKYRLLALSLVGLIVAFSVFWSIEYANTTTTAGKVFSSTLRQSNASHSGMYSSYGQRFGLFWKEFVRYSGSISWAWSKVVVYVLIFAFSIRLLFHEFLKFRKQKQISENSLFILSLVAFLVVYVSWWFFLGSKPWYRRFLNADILFFIILPVISGALGITNKKLQTGLKYSIVVLLLLFTFSYVDVFFQRRSFIFRDVPKGTVELDVQMKAGLKKLPSNFNGYGYGWWQAPRWSFVSGKKFRDIYSLSKLEKYRLLKDKNKHYIFFESENSLDKGGLKHIHKRYDLKEVYSCSKGKIKQIVGVPGISADEEIKQFVDFSESNYALIDGAYQRERKEFKWCRQKCELLLASHSSAMFGVTLLMPDLKNFSKPAIDIEVLFNNEPVYTYHTTKQGRNDINFPVEDQFLNKDVVVTFRSSDDFKPEGDRRRLAFALYKAGFYGKATLSYVDYSKQDESFSKGMYNREAQLFKWSTQKSQISLATKNKKTFHMKYKVASTADYGKKLELTVKLDGKVIKTRTHKSGGQKEIRVDLPQEYQNKNVLIELESNGALQNIADKRELSFAVYSIGFK